MQIARYEPFTHGADAGGSDQRRHAAPVERVLEGELLRGERREGRDRRYTTPETEQPPSLQDLRLDSPPPVTPGNSAIAAYLRAADPGRYVPASRMRLVA